MGSASLLQHYGFPTEVVDTTSSVDVAAAFAAAHAMPDTPGRILAYPTKKLSTQAIIIDLSMIAWARRPKRQQAYMIFHRKFQNWQNQLLVADLRVVEHRFVCTEGERRRYDQTSALVGPASSDPVCGFLHCLVHDQIIPNLAPLPSEVDRWLEDRIPWAVFPIRESGKKGQYEPALDKFANFVAEKHPDVVNSASQRSMAVNRD